MKSVKLVAVAVYFLIIALSFIFYDNINSTLPVYGEITAEKNLYWATRIQCINLLSFFAIFILGNSILRYKDFKKSNVVVFLLIAIVVFKGVVEFFALFNAQLLENFAYILIPTLLLGISIVLYHLVSFFTSEKLKNIRFSMSEKIQLLIISIAYVAINIPSILYVMQSK